MRGCGEHEVFVTEEPIVLHVDNGHTGTVTTRKRTQCCQANRLRGRRKVVLQRRKILGRCRGGERSGGGGDVRRIDFRERIQGGDERRRLRLSN
jgi:hypothetical protein